MARQQQKALYASEQRGGILHGSGYSFIDDHLFVHGSGFFSDVWKTARKIARAATAPIRAVVQRVGDVTRGVRDAYPPNVRSVIGEYGPGVVANILIRREPIMSFVDKALNFITLGRWQKAKEDLHYDKLYHLGMVVSLTMPDGLERAVLIEKNEVINITPNFAMTPKMDYVRVPITQQLTLRDMLDNAKNFMGEDYFRYDPFKNNCQRFIDSILSANELNTPTAHAFIVQPVDELLKKLPGYTGKVARAITDVAAVADVAIRGRALKKGGRAGFQGRTAIQEQTLAAEEERRAAMQPGEELVACKVKDDLSLGRNVVSKARCKELHDARFAKWEAENNPIRAKFFRPVVEGLTKVADLAVENVPGLNTVAKEAYKTFAPPGSQYYQPGTIAEKAARAALGAGKPGYYVYVINLKKRQDRKQQFLKAWKEAGLPDSVLHWVVGVDGSTLDLEDYPDFHTVAKDEAAQKGRLGAYLSHIKAIEQASAKGHFPLIVMEDDALPSSNSVDIAAMFRKAPKDARLLYFGALPVMDGKAVKLKKMSSGWHPIPSGVKLYGGHAYGLLTKDDASNLLDVLGENPMTFDSVLVKYQQEKPSYFMHPFVFYQSQGFSDIEQKKRGVRGNGKKDNKWIQEANIKEGAFTAQAKRHKMTAEQFMKHVLENPDKFTETTRRRAQFMKNVKGGRAPIKIPYEDFLAEHKKLLDILQHPTPEKLRAEYKDQSAELKKVQGKGCGCGCEGGVKPPSGWLKVVKQIAKNAGYDPASIREATGKQKLIITTPEGKEVGFGAAGMGDYIIYSLLEKAGKAEPGTAEKHRKAYLSRATKIKGDWKADKYSPNNLAIRILWAG